MPQADFGKEELIVIGTSGPRQDVEAVEIQPCHVHGMHEQDNHIQESVKPVHLAELNADECGRDDPGDVTDLNAHDGTIHAFFENDD